MFCLVISLCFFIILFLFKLELITCIMFGWDFFCLITILLSWIIFFTTSRDSLHLLAKNQDENLPVIFTMILVTVCFSLFGILVVLFYNDLNFINKELRSIVSLLGVGFSWLLLHTIFTTRYAHLYYERMDEKSDANPGGLCFPDEKEPDYIDFAYFSFVIGMTFQVSDVSITSRRLRRFVLMHALISFVFNTIIVALTINILASLKS